MPLYFTFNHKTHAPLDRPITDFTRFHAKWHRDQFQPTRADRWPDWNFLTTQGRGRFVGMMLHAFIPDPRRVGPARDLHGHRRQIRATGRNPHRRHHARFPPSLGQGLGVIWADAIQLVIDKYLRRRRGSLGSFRSPYVRALFSPGALLFRLRASNFNLGSAIFRS
jgi:hypothetical protein